MDFVDPLSTNERMRLVRRYQLRVDYRTMIRSGKYDAKFKRLGDVGLTLLARAAG